VLLTATNNINYSLARIARCLGDVTASAAAAAAAAATANHLTSLAQRQPASALGRWPY